MPMKKGVRHIVYDPGDLVLRHTPQLKPGEAGKFLRQWQGTFKTVKQVTEVTYLPTKRKLEEVSSGSF